jgi:hypothetical protein
LTNETSQSGAIKGEGHTVAEILLCLVRVVNLSNQHVT